MVQKQETLDGEYSTRVMFASVEYRKSVLSDVDEDLEEIPDYVTEIKKSLDNNQGKIFPYHSREKSKMDIRYSCHIETELVKYDKKGRHCLLGTFAIYKMDETYPGLDEVTGEKLDEVPYPVPPQDNEIQFLFTPDKKLVIQKHREITDIFFEKFAGWVKFRADIPRYFRMTQLESLEELRKVIPTLKRIDSITFSNLRLPNPNSSEGTIIGLQFVRDWGIEELKVKTNSPLGRDAPRKPRKSINKQSKYLESFLAIVDHALGEIKEFIGEKQNGEPYIYKKGKQLIVKDVKLNITDSSIERVEKLIEVVKKAFKFD